MDTPKAQQPTYHIATLGCEKNSVDSEGMSSLLSDAGYAAAGAGDADVLIVNTCGFLHASTDQSVGVLHELDAQRKPGQLLIAAGCAAVTVPPARRCSTSVTISGHWRVLSSASMPATRPFSSSP